MTVTYAPTGVRCDASYLDLIREGAARARELADAKRADEARETWKAVVAWIGEAAEAAGLPASGVAPYAVDTTTGELFAAKVED